MRERLQIRNELTTLQIKYEELHYQLLDHDADDPVEIIHHKIRTVEVQIQTLEWVLGKRDTL